MPLFVIECREFQAKVHYSISYAVLYLLSIKVVAGRFHMWMLAVFLGLGILVEFAYPLMEYSKNDAWDAVANASGVILVAGIISLVKQNKGVVVDH